MGHRSSRGTEWPLLSHQSATEQRWSMLHAPSIPRALRMVKDNLCTLAGVRSRYILWTKGRGPFQLRTREKGDTRRIDIIPVLKEFLNAYALAFTRYIVLPHKAHTYPHESERYHTFLYDRFLYDISE